MEGPWGGFALMEDGHLVDLVLTAWLAAKGPPRGRKREGGYFGNPDMLHVLQL